MLPDLLRYFDLSVFHAINGWSGNPTLDRIASYEEGTYLLKGALVSAAYWGMWFVPNPQRRLMNRQTIVAALAGTIVAIIAARALANMLPFRPRPMYVPGIDYHAPTSATYDMEDWSSFPSDTACLWLALTFGLFRMSKPLGAVLMAYSVAWMCLVRIYFGIHYPSDLVAGAAIGIACVWGADRLLMARSNALGRPVMDRVLSFEQRAPHIFYSVSFLFLYEVTCIFNGVRQPLRAIAKLLKAHGSAGAESTLVVAVAAGALACAAIVGLVYLLKRRRGAIGSGQRDDFGPTVKLGHRADSGPLGTLGPKRQA